MNDCGERDMPVFTKEYCEYEGIERDEYVTIEIVSVRISLPVDEAKIINSIIGAILTCGKFMKNSCLLQATIYDIDDEDIEAIRNLTSVFEQQITNIEKCTN